MRALFTGIYWSKVVAWAATVFCVYLSARCAAVFAKNSPRVFTILALLSLNWALLVPFYSALAPSFLIVGFAGFLLVYIGVLLRREAEDPLVAVQVPPRARGKKKDGRSDTEDRGKNSRVVARKDRITLWLLVLLIGPSFVTLPFLPEDLARPNRRYTEPIISSIITYFGYFSVCSAIRVYSSNKKAWILMTLIAVPYAVVDAIFTYLAIASALPKTDCASNFFRCEPTVMSPPFLYLFAVLKILFTTSLVYFILKESLSEEDRRLSTIDKLLKFFGFI